VALVAVMVSLTFPASDAALAANVALVLPAGIRTVEGMATFGLLPPSVTFTPAPEAALLSVTEQLLE